MIDRWDAWSKQNTTPDEKGRYGYTTQKYPLSHKIIDDSLLGIMTTIGGYTVKPGENTVVNPTIDIDNHDGKIDIINEVIIVYNALQSAGMFPYIEASAGLLKDGAHIGTICKPTLAAIAKRAIEAILKTTGLKHEVNPKQERVETVGYGNLVKLPWQYNNRTKKRSKIINPETLEPFERQDAIKYMLELPDTVFQETEPIEIYIQPKIEAPKIAIEADKASIGLSEFLKNPKIKPCITSAYTDAWVLHGKGDDGHNFRLAIAGNLIYNGATDEQVHEYFKIQDDYSQKATNYQLKTIKEYLATNKKPMGCKKIAPLFLMVCVQPALRSRKRRR